MLSSVAAQYRFDHWTADNGLPQNSVRDIVQTRDGYLWLATFDGLVRFDGVRFTVFNKSNAPGIITNRFTQLFEDVQGDLWAVTEGGEVTRRHAGRFTSYTKEQGLFVQPPVHIGGDGRGNPLLASAGHLWRWADGQFQPADDYRLPAGSGADGARQSAEPLLLSLDGIRMLAFLDGQLFRWDPREIQPRGGHPLVDQHGKIWLSTLQGVYQFTDGRLLPSGIPGGQLAGGLSILVGGRPSVQALTIAADGSLWLTELDTQQSRVIAPRLPESTNNTGNPVGSLFVAYFDREGNLWLGSLYDGLYRARPQSITAYAQPHGLSVTEVYPLLEGRDGALWIGAQSVFRLQGGAFTRYDGRGSFSNLITTLYQDRAGYLWVNGQWRWEQGRFVRGRKEDVNWESLREIYTMHEDRTGAHWLGAFGGVLRMQNGIATHFTTKDGLAGDDTKVIIDDGADGLWLGSYGGLTHYRNGQFQRWTEKDGLPGATVRSLYQDADGALWIGTYDSGLGRFKDGKFTRYTTRDGLFDSGVFQILEDDYGWFWMSCNRGIYRVRKQELLDFADGKVNAITSVAYGKSDGMLNVECNGGRWPAGVKGRDGKLWFPTMGGVVMIDPANVKANTQPPPVVIEGMKINNEAVPNEVWHSALRTPHSAIQVRPGQENFEIEYTALSFINSENLRFKYKLEGADTDWVDADTRRTAYFSHLAPGEYTFKVIAANSDGVWNNEGQSLRITVLPPFYRTWWFVLLMVGTLLGLATLAYQYRIRQLQTLQRAQQNFSRQLIASQEAERKRIAAELHDSLGQHLVVIKNLALMWLQRHANDEAQPIRDISATTSQAISEVKEISYNLRPYQLDRIGLTKAIAALLKKAEAASGIRFTAALDDLQEALPKESEINFYRIVQECVNNILKHSQATEAIVTIRRRGQLLRLMIQDNGKGFTPSVAAGDKHGFGQQGFGLIGIHERAQLLGGEAVIQSSPNQGTTVTLELTLLPGGPGDKR